MPAATVIPALIVYIQVAAITSILSLRETEMGRCDNWQELSKQSYFSFEEIIHLELGIM